jgi:hypothetical protein
LVCETAEWTVAREVRLGCWTFGVEAFFFLIVLAVVLAGAVTRPVFERPGLAFAGADLRLEPLAAFAALAAVFFTGRTGLLILAETLASLLLAAELDFDDLLIDFAGRLDDFLGAFFRVDMADFLLKPSASSLR